MLFLILCTFSEDEQAQIEQLFKENHDLLYKISYQLLRSETDAEDAVAQAFLNIMEHFEKISRLSRPERRPYCVVIAKNTSYDILRRKKRMIPVEEFYGDDTDDDVADTFFEKFKKSQLIDALNLLDKNDRTLLTFRFGRDMPLKDLAVLMEISEETAKKRSQRALKKLRKILEEFER